MISAKFLIAGAAVVALIFHPSLNRNFIADYFWAFTQFLEAIAVLPQLIMFSKKVINYLFRVEISNLTLDTLLLLKLFQEFSQLYFGFFVINN
jgi:hypothetical protein